MVGALTRWFKAIGYLLTGQIDSARKTLDTNPHVIRAKFDDIAREKTARIHQYKQAVAGLIAQEENKVHKVKNLTEEIRRLEDLKSGALAKAKKVAEDLKAKGLDKEAIHKNEDYLKCLGAFNDFNSTLAEKQQRIEEIEADLGEYKGKIAEHKVQLQSLLRDVEKLKAEAADTIADVITAKEEREIADTLSGISQDGTAAELQRMRELRQEIKAEARISRELAGTDTKVQEAEFLEYARVSESSDEFDKLIGLAEEADKGPAAQDTEAPARDASLPE
jgi:phage shock protein A